MNTKSSLGALFLTGALFFTLCFSSSAQTCQTHTLSTSNAYATCVDLPVLDSFLHWTYDQASGSLKIAFRRPQTTENTWISWAINPEGQKMIGSQALVAYKNSSGVRAFTSPITGYSLPEGTLSFGVTNLTANYDTSNSEMTIMAILQLGSGSSVTQIWQEGPLSGGVPASHVTSGDNVRSMGTLDLLSGQAVAGGGGSSSRARRRNIHGVLNAVSWGTLLPIGAMLARYLKVFKAADPAWFYLHIACQSSAYIIGVAGWGTGLKLGSDSPGIQHDSHRNIGITLFALGTLQVFALLLRPNKDHKYRFYWNIYHHTIGYTVIILSIVNIFKGFDILDPEKKWKKIYIGIIIFLGIVALILEAVTWFIVIKRKKTNSNKLSHSSNGANGVQSYAA